MTHRTKLLLLIPHLGGGGAERVTEQLARRLDPRDFDIHLCLIAKDSHGAKYIPRWVQIHRFECKRVRNACFRLLHLICVEKPDVVLSNMAHLNFLLLLIKPLLPIRTRVLVRQNTTASSVAQSWFSRLPYRHLYSRADAILCQSEAMAADLATTFSIPSEKLKVLANPIDVSAIRTACVTNPPLANPQTAGPRLLTVSRLGREKGIDLLLRAMPRITQQYPHAHLTILGTGPETSALFRLAAELNLEAAVSFPGYRDHLAGYYAEATLFVLPSRYEGMPNALLEAAAAGLPLAATPCSAGLCELLRNVPGTWLSPNISAESLAETILAAISQLPAPPNPPQRFHHAFLSNFETRTAIAAFAALIQQHAAQAQS